MRSVSVINVGVALLHATCWDSEARRQTDNDDFMQQPWRDPHLYYKFAVLA